MNAQTLLQTLFRFPHNKLIEAQYELISTQREAIEFRNKAIETLEARIILLEQGN